MIETKKWDPEMEIQEQLNQKARRKGIMENLLPYLGLVFVILFFTVVCWDTFVDMNNLENLIYQCFTYVIVAVGAQFIYATGCMDMSMGTVMSMCMLISALTIRMGLPWWGGLLAAIAAGIALDLLIAVTFQFLHVPVFVVSLCAMYLLQGVLQTLIQKDVSVDYTSIAWLNSPVIKVMVILAVVAAGYYLFHGSKFGMKLRSIGSSRLAAQQAGIRCTLLVCLGFVMMGACIGVAGFFTLTRTGSTNATAGTGIMLNIMIAMVLGGNPLSGGAKSRLVKAIVGALTVTVLGNGLTLMGLAPALVGAVKGLLYLTIVMISYDKSRGVLVS